MEKTDNRDPYRSTVYAPAAWIDFDTERVRTSAIVAVGTAEGVSWGVWKVKIWLLGGTCLAEKYEVRGEDSTSAADHAAAKEKALARKAEIRALIGDV